MSVLRLILYHTEMINHDSNQKNHFDPTHEDCELVSSRCRISLTTFLSVVVEPDQLMLLSSWRSVMINRPTAVAFRICRTYSKQKTSHVINNRNQAQHTNGNECNSMLQSLLITLSRTTFVRARPVYSFTAASNLCTLPDL